MPQPDEVVDLDEELSRYYAEAWDEIERRQAEILNDPARWREQRRLTSLQERVNTLTADLDARQRAWWSEKYPTAYARGVGDVTGSPIEWNLLHQQAIEQLAAEGSGALLQATRYVRADTKRWIRDIVQRSAMMSNLTGQTAVQAGRNAQREMEARGIKAVTYRDGSRHGLREYSQMALRTKTAEAYNTGTVNGYPGVTWWEIFDGPKCGLTFHDDPQLANGMIVHREEALKWRISHPNCRRSYGPRPDIKGRGDDKLRGRRHLGRRVFLGYQGLKFAERVFGLAQDVMSARDIIRYAREDWEYLKYQFASRGIAIGETSFSTTRALVPYQGDDLGLFFIDEFSLAAQERRFKMLRAQLDETLNRAQSNRLALGPGDVNTRYLPVHVPAPAKPPRFIEFPWVPQPTPMAERGIPSRTGHVATTERFIWQLKHGDQVTDELQAFMDELAYERKVSDTMRAALHDRRVTGVIDPSNPAHRLSDDVLNLINSSKKTGSLQVKLDPAAVEQINDAIDTMGGAAAGNLTLSLDGVVGTGRRSAGLIDGAGQVILRLENAPGFRVASIAAEEALTEVHVDDDEVWAQVRDFTRQQIESTDGYTYIGTWISQFPELGLTYSDFYSDEHQDRIDLEVIPGSMLDKGSLLYKFVRGLFSSVKDWEGERRNLVLTAGEFVVTHVVELTTPDGIPYREVVLDWRGMTPQQASRRPAIPLEEVPGERERLSAWRRRTPPAVYNYAFPPTTPPRRNPHGTWENEFGSGSEGEKEFKRKYWKQSADMGQAAATRIAEAYVLEPDEAASFLLDWVALEDDVLQTRVDQIKQLLQSGDAKYYVMEGTQRNEAGRGFFSGFQVFDTRTRSPRDSDIPLLSPDFMFALKYYVLDRMIRGWNGWPIQQNRLGTTMLQWALAAEFGMDDHFDQITGKFSQPLLNRMESFWREYEEPFRWLVRVIYEETQRDFQEAGITHVLIHRGMNQAKNNGTALIDEDKITHRPSRTEAILTQQRWRPGSSWSYQRSTASNFGDGHEFTVYAPVEAIWSHPGTGPGVPSEGEMVLMDYRGTLHVTLPSHYRPPTPSRFVPIETKGYGWVQAALGQAVLENGVIMIPSPWDVEGDYAPIPPQLLYIADQPVSDYGSLGKYATAGANRVAYHLKEIAKLAVDWHHVIYDGAPYDPNELINAWRDLLKIPPSQRPEKDADQAIEFVRGVLGLTESVLTPDWLQLERIEIKHDPNLLDTVNKHDVWDLISESVGRAIETNTFGPTPTVDIDDTSKFDLFDAKLDALPDLTTLQAVKSVIEDVWDPVLAKQFEKALAELNDAIPGKLFPLVSGTNEVELLKLSDGTLQGPFSPALMAAAGAFPTEPATTIKAKVMLFATTVGLWGNPTVATPAKLAQAVNQWEKNTGTTYDVNDHFATPYSTLVGAKVTLALPDAVKKTISVVFDIPEADITESVAETFNTLIFGAAGPTQFNPGLSTLSQLSYAYHLHKATSTHVGESSLPEVDKDAILTKLGKRTAQIQDAIKSGATYTPGQLVSIYSQISKATAAEIIDELPIKVAVIPEAAPRVWVPIAQKVLPLIAEHLNLPDVKAILDAELPKVTTPDQVDTVIDDAFQRATGGFPTGEFMGYYLATLTPDLPAVYDLLTLTDTFATVGELAPLVSDFGDWLKLNPPNPVPAAKQPDFEKRVDQLVADVIFNFPSKADAPVTLGQLHAMVVEASSNPAVADMLIDSVRNSGVQLTDPLLGRQPKPGEVSEEQWTNMASVLAADIDYLLEQMIETEQVSESDRKMVAEELQQFWSAWEPGATLDDFKEQVSELLAEEFGMPLIITEAGTNALVVTGNVGLSAVVTADSQTKPVLLKLLKDATTSDKAVVLAEEIVDSFINKLANGIWTPSDFIAHVALWVFPLGLGDDVDWSLLGLTVEQYATQALAPPEPAPAPTPPPTEIPPDPELYHDLAFFMTPSEKEIFGGAVMNHYEAVVGELPDEAFEKFQHAGDVTSELVDLLEEDPSWNNLTLGAVINKLAAIWAAQANPVADEVWGKLLKAVTFEATKLGYIKDAAIELDQATLSVQLTPDVLKAVITHTQKFITGYKAGVYATAEEYTEDEFDSILIQLTKMHDVLDADKSKILNLGTALELTQWMTTYLQDLFNKYAWNQEAMLIENAYKKFLNAVIANPTLLKKYDVTAAPPSDPAPVAPSPVGTHNIKWGTFMTAIGNAFDDNPAFKMLALGEMDAWFSNAGDEPLPDVVTWVQIQQAFSDNGWADQVGKLSPHLSKLTAPAPASSKPLYVTSGAFKGIAAALYSALSDTANAYLSVAGENAFGVALDELYAKHVVGLKGDENDLILLHHAIHALQQVINEGLGDGVNSFPAVLPSAPVHEDFDEVLKLLKATANPAPEPDFEALLPPEEESVAVIPSKTAAIESLVQQKTKADLLAMADALNVYVAKSWTKTKIATAIIDAPAPADKVPATTADLSTPLSFDVINKLDTEVFGMVHTDVMNSDPTKILSLTNEWESEVFNVVTEGMTGGQVWALYLDVIKQFVPANESVYYEAFITELQKVTTKETPAGLPVPPAKPTPPPPTTGLPMLTVGMSASAWNKILKEVQVFIALWADEMESDTALAAFELKDIQDAIGHLHDDLAELPPPATWEEAGIVVKEKVESWLSAYTEQGLVPVEPAVQFVEPLFAQFDHPVAIEEFSLHGFNQAQIASIVTDTIVAWGQEATLGDILTEINEQYLGDLGTPEHLHQITSLLYFADETEQLLWNQLLAQVATVYKFKEPGTSVYKQYAHTLEQIDLAVIGEPGMPFKQLVSNLSKLPDDVITQMFGKVDTIDELAVLIASAHLHAKQNGWWPGFAPPTTLAHDLVTFATTESNWADVAELLYDLEWSTQVTGVGSFAELDEDSKEILIVEARQTLQAIATAADKLTAQPLPQALIAAFKSIPSTTYVDAFWAVLDDEYGEGSLEFDSAWAIIQKWSQSEFGPEAKSGYEIASLFQHNPDLLTPKLFEALSARLLNAYLSAENPNAPIAAMGSAFTEHIKPDFGWTHYHVKTILTQWALTTPASTKLNSIKLTKVLKHLQATWPFGNDSVPTDFALTAIQLAFKAALIDKTEAVDLAASFADYVEGTLLKAAVVEEAAAVPAPEPPPAPVKEVKFDGMGTKVKVGALKATLSQFLKPYEPYGEPFKIEETLELFHADAEITLQDFMIEALDLRDLHGFANVTHGDEANSAGWSLWIRAMVDVALSAIGVKLDHPIGDGPLVSNFTQEIIDQVQVPWSTVAHNTLDTWMKTTTKSGLAFTLQSINDMIDDVLILVEDLIQQVGGVLSAETPYGHHTLSALADKVYDHMSTGDMVEHFDVQWVHETLSTLVAQLSGMIHAKNQITFAAAVSQLAPAAATANPPTAPPPTAIAKATWYAATTMVEEAVAADPTIGALNVDNLLALWSPTATIVEYLDQLKKELTKIGGWDKHGKELTKKVTNLFSSHGEAEQSMPKPVDPTVSLDPSKPDGPGVKLPAAAQILAPLIAGKELPPPLISVKAALRLVMDDAVAKLVEEQVADTWQRMDSALEAKNLVIQAVDIVSSTLPKKQKLGLADKVGSLPVWGSHADALKWDFSDLTKMVPDIVEAVIQIMAEEGVDPSPAKHAATTVKNVLTKLAKDTATTPMTVAKAYDFVMNGLDDMAPEGKLKTAKKAFPLVRSLVEDNLKSTLYQVGFPVTPQTMMPYLKYLPETIPVHTLPHGLELTKIDDHYGGSHGNTFYTDQNGNTWMWKKATTGGAHNPVVAFGEVVAYEIGTSLGLQMSAVFIVPKPGAPPGTEIGTLQRFLPDSRSMPGNPYGGDPLGLTQEQLNDVMAEQVFDWLIGQHDSSLNNFVKTGDGRLHGIDKGQAFKWFGTDELSDTYSPNPTQPIYNIVWSYFKQGKLAQEGLTLDPDAIGDILYRVDQLDDDKFYLLAYKYAQARFAHKFALSDLPDGVDTPEKLAALILWRKKTIRQAFSELYERMFEAAGIPLAAEEPPEPFTLPEIPEVPVGKAALPPEPLPSPLIKPKLNAPAKKPQTWGPNGLWGIFGGAAGILFKHTDENGVVRFYLDQRAEWVDQGGTWSVPGGAIDYGESAIEGAVREVDEEIHIPLTYTITSAFEAVVDPTWSYTTFIAEVDEQFTVTSTSSESTGGGWFTLEEALKLKLHPAFAKNAEKLMKDGGDIPLNVHAADVGKPETHQAPQPTTVPIQVDTHGTIAHAVAGAPDWFLPDQHVPLVPDVILQDQTGVLPDIDPADPAVAKVLIQLLALGYTTQAPLESIALLAFQSHKALDKLGIPPGATSLASATYVNDLMTKFIHSVATSHSLAGLQTWATFLLNSTDNVDELAGKPSLYWERWGLNNPTIWPIKPLGWDKGLLITAMLIEATGGNLGQSRAKLAYDLFTWPGFVGDVTEIFPPPYKIPSEKLTYHGVPRAYRMLANISQHDDRDTVQQKISDFYGKLINGVP